MIKQFFKTQRLFLICITILIIYSSLSIFLNLAYLNNDSILYLRQAHGFIEDKNLALSIYNWPFFSIYIFFTSYLTGLNENYSARVLIFILSSISLFFSLMIGKNNKTNNKGNSFLIIATIFFLSSSIIFNKYLPMIIRDHGLVSFIMISLFFYTRWLDYKKIYFLLFSFFSLLIASTFRPEAISYLLIFFIFSYFVNKIYFINILKFLIVLFMIFVIFFIYYIDSSFLIDSHFTNLTKRFFSIFDNILKPIPIYSGDLWLQKLIESNNLFLKFILLLSIFIKKIFIATWIYLLVLFVLRKHIFDVIYKNKLLLLIISFILFNLLLTFVNFIATYVFSTRYLLLSFYLIPILLSLLIVEIVNYKNLKLFINLKSFKLSLIHLTFVIIIISIFFNFFNLKKNDSYEYVAGKWIRDNIGYENVFFNDRKIAYYVQGKFIDKFSLNQSILLNYDYFVFKNITSNEEKLFDSGYQIIKSFPTDERPKVVIYKRRANY